MGKPLEAVKLLQPHAAVLTLNAAVCVVCHLLWTSTHRLMFPFIFMCVQQSLAHKTNLLWLLCSPLKSGSVFKPKVTHGITENEVFVTVT